MNVSVVETRSVSSSWDKSAEMPDDWAGGDRRRGGVKLDIGFHAELQEPVAPMQGRSSSGENRKARVPMRSTGADRPVGAMKAL